MNHNITILTYNVLSSNLADLMVNQQKDNKIIYSSDIMDNNYRFKKISEFIKNQIMTTLESNLIICLQEVSEDWLSLFSQLFSSLNYLSINVQHGRIFDGNMGVLIAYPSKLSIIKSEFYSVGQHIIITDEISKISASKTNTAILLILGDPYSNFKFGIVTYHMPLEPTRHQVSLSHIKVLYKKIIRYMNGTGWILAGDFNILPDSKTYMFLTNQNNIGCIWKDKLNYYPLTNHAYIKNFEFSGCLDYIFYTKDKLKCNNVVVNMIKNIIPDQYNPSDHIPILAEFSMIN